MTTTWQRLRFDNRVCWVRNSVSIEEIRRFIRLASDGAFEGMSGDDLATAMLSQGFAPGDFVKEPQPVVDPVSQAIAELSADLSAEIDAIQSEMDIIQLGVRQHCYHQLRAVITLFKSAQPKNYEAGAFKRQFLEMVSHQLDEACRGDQ